MAEPVRFQHFEVPRREDGSLHELGRGAMGVTYKAFDTNLRCFVALKVINASYLGNDVARQRFLREARAAAALRHPNVATVFHLGEEGGDWFYAMEYVDGETVEALMKREGAVSATTALRIVLQVARALGAAQKQGLVHRDIKPSNLMIVREDDSEFTVKVIDFGLAKNAAGGDESAALTLGGFVGTPHFASPEQLEECELDVRSDIYSLGVTLFHMLAGKVPFSGSLAQVMSQHLHREPPLEALAGQSPAVLDLLRKMLAKDPAMRQQTPADLRQEIETCLVSATVPASSPVVPVADQNFETQAIDAAPPAGGPASEGTRNTAVRPAFADDRGIAASPGDFVPPDPNTRSGQTTQPNAKENPGGPPVPRLAGFLLLLVLVAVGGGFVYLKLPRPSGSPGVVLPSPVPAPKPLASTPSATPAPVATTTPIATATLASTPTATPSPVATTTPIATATPDLPASAPDEALRTFAADPAPALSKLLELLRSNPGKPEVRASLEQCLAKLVRKPLTPGQIAALRDPLEAAAGMDFADAQFLLGGHLRETDSSASLKWFLAAANNGHPAAMVQTGLVLSNKHGTAPPDLPGAALWFQRAAQKDDSTAMSLLAECYLDGKGVARDPRLAIELLEKAVEKNDPSAMNELGDLYKKGIPGFLDPDFEKSFRLFSHAKDLGFDDALGNLGALFLMGQGVEKNEKTGLALFREGVAKGNGICIYNYAKCLENGWAGVSVDKEAARQMYVNAAQAGNDRARQWCREKNIPFGAVPAPVSPGSPPRQ